MAVSWNDRVARDLLRVAQAIYLDAATTVDKGMLAMGSVEGATVRPLSVNADGELRVNLELSDIEIGAVELKDADSSVRADIELDRAKNALYIQSEIYELWNAWNRLKVSAIVGQSGLAGGAGAQSGDTIRTVTATDSPDVTALEIIDDWDLNDVARVSPIVGQTSIATGTGAQDIRTTRTVTATDSPDVTALEIMDDWDFGDRAKVSAIVGQCGIAGGAGAQDVTTTRTVTATDSPDVTALELIDDAIYANAAASIVRGMLAMGAVAGATIRALSVNEDGELLINLEAGDIQIGAVELKDADSAVRADIELDRAKNALYTQSELHELWNEWNRVKVDAIVGQSGIAGGSGVQSGATVRTVAATDSPEVTALEIIDDWDLNDVARVSPIVGQTAISAGAGAQDVRTTRTVTATDSPDVTALEIMDDWDLNDVARISPIVGQTAIAAGAGAQDVRTTRTVTATDSPDTVALQIIDDWDLNDVARVSPIVGQTSIAAGAGAQDVRTTRTVTATDSPDVTALQIIDDWDESDRAKVNPIASQAGVAANAGAADALTVRIVTASDSPDTVALERIEEWHGVHDTAVGSCVALIGYEAKDQDGSAFPNAVTEGDTVRPAASLYGVQYVKLVNEDGSQSVEDEANNVLRMMEVNDARQQAVTWELQSATLTTSISRQIGDEINCQGFNTLAIYVDYVNGTETKVTITPSFLRVSGGDEHPIGSWDAAAGSKAWTADSFDISATSKVYMVLDVAGLNYTILKEIASDVNPTGTLQISASLVNNA